MARPDIVRTVRPRSAVLAVVVLGLVLGACGGDDDSESVETAADTGAGAALYAANCASCHGDDLRGTDQGPSHLSAVYAADHHPDDSFRRAIEGGATAHHWNFGDMAPVPGLDDAEIDAIIAFIRSVQDEEGLEPYPPE